MLLRSRAELEALREKLAAEAQSHKQDVLVCCGPGCLASGANEVARALGRELEAHGLDAKAGIHCKRTGCQGLCERGPLVSLEPAGILYTKVRPGDAAAIALESVQQGKVLEKLCYKDPASKKVLTRGAEIPFYVHQQRLVLRRIGTIDPESLDDALAHGAYRALAKALFDLGPEAVLAAVEKSGLRGRGGAGFATARKWQSARAAPGSRKLIVCNGDEGDPGAFKDRALMEGDPHAVVEGMIIGAFAVGAHEGFIYVRDEYPLAVVNLQRAIVQARDLGLLGMDILGSGFAFNIRISRGGGAFVCGESSALMRSLEGKVGEPRQKYTHATERGLFDCPTVLNNVETWADVATIIDNGPEPFAALGTVKSKGTKAFSLVGKVKNTGLIELPMGTTLRQIIFDIGGGMQNDRPFKAVQTGGPSGGCVPADLLDLPVDYEKLTEAGSMMGSGGMIVMDDRTCMVDVARYFLAFLIEESCGKCTPCREGLRQLCAIYEALVSGRGAPGDIERIERLARAMQLASLCELGKSAPNPVLSTLKYFRSEYEAHLTGACPAGLCRELTQYEIVPEPCDGCHACVHVCPTEAIVGGVKEVHVIIQEKCLSCGSCFDACNRDAIRYFPKRSRLAAATERQAS
jgi:NADH:ubiquinone oxidoreductase subunit F (NADH-binding)/(2Fe-2S) ferredoxin/Pyruvate/2-oxoacid:ferredoxin oxidoreductase delta subunit